MATQFENGLTMNQLAERNAELVTEVEKLRAERDASLNAERTWEKTMMEVCGEDGPASVADVIKQVAAENVGLKQAAEFATAPDMWVEQADGMLDYRYHEWYVDVLKAAMETPATDSIYAAAEARAVRQFAAAMAAQHAKCQAGGYFDRQVKVYGKAQELAESYLMQLREVSK